jgi:methylthioribose-1-phosphate isomerase
MTPNAIEWGQDHLRLLDQRVLPHEQTYLEYRDPLAVAEAITDMVVRGAPAIGITAAYGVVLAARQVEPHLVSTSGSSWLSAMEPALEALAASRPTAVNLFWALERARQMIEIGGTELPAQLESMARSIHTADIAANRHMGQLGAGLLAPNSVIYTHCNAGALATGGYGTALGVVRAGFETGKVSHVYAGETRPWLQGSRLTAWELASEGIPHALAVEGAAGYLMKTGKIDWVIVGSDRVAANGDVCNKVGTYNLAVLARHHGVRFMAVMPSSTVDMSLASGDDIPIEQRHADEVTHWRGERISPCDTAAVNPAFDVTPADLVDAIVTERGILQQPTTAKLAALMKKQGGISAG